MACGLGQAAGEIEPGSHEGQAKGPCSREFDHRRSQEPELVDDCRADHLSKQDAKDGIGDAEARADEGDR